MNVTHLFLQGLCMLFSRTFSQIKQIVSRKQAAYALNLYPAERQSGKREPSLDCRSQLAVDCASLDEARAALDPGTVLLSYSVNEDHAVLFIQTPRYVQTSRHQLFHDSEHSPVIFLALDEVAALEEEIAEIIQDGGGTQTSRSQRLVDGKSATVIILCLGKPATCLGNHTQVIQAAGHVQALGSQSFPDRKSSVTVLLRVGKIAVLISNDAEKVQAG